MNGEAEQEPEEMAVDTRASGDQDSSSVAPAADTPSAKKVATNGGSSKKKAAVPEHKSKKLNKKKSRPLTNLGGKFPFLHKFTYPVSCK